MVRMNGYKPPDQFMHHMLKGLEHRESLDEVLALAEASPEDAEVQYALGDVQFALQQYEEARTTLERVIAMEDEDSLHLVDDIERAFLELWFSDIARRALLEAADKF